MLFERLPTELVCQILLCAATDSASTARSWVVQLALVSRAVYQVVRPVLYETMVVTRHNHPELRVLAQEDASSHVFRSVRRLVADDSLNLWDPDRLRDLLAGVTSIDAPLASIQILSASPAFRPKVLAVRYCLLANFLGELPAATLASVTHLTGYFPSGDYPSHTLTDERIAHMLEMLPSLTHIAFDVLDLLRDESGSDSDEEDELTPGVLELDALARALRAALQHPRTQAVAVRVGGDWEHHGPAVIDIARQLRDPRLYVWYDERPMRSWAREADYAASDAWAGRNIWTEARPVWQPSD